MALPLASATRGSRRRRLRRWSGLGLLLFAMMTIAVSAAWAGDDPYSATVKVDATADNVAAARDQARIDGQRRALGKVIEQLSGSPDPAKLAKLSDQSITDLVDSFEVAHERMSAVRYLAEYTFHFRPAKIKRLVPTAEAATQSAPSAAGRAPADGAATAAISPSGEAGAKPVIVLPVYRGGGRAVLWDDPNPWREAWARRPAEGGPVRLSVPLGDIGDLNTIDAAQATAAGPDALAAIAQRNGGDETVVAEAMPRTDGGRLAGLDLSLKRYRLGRLVDSQTEAVDANPGESAADLMARAVELAAADLGKQGPAPDRPATLAAIVPLTSLGDWVQMRERLASVPSIRKVDLLSLTREEAKIEIKYIGDPEQLKSALAGLALDLGGGDPEWRLLPAGAPRMR
jgi:hypothetical protein